ncbi:hypothetical protein Tco_0122767 [Tanacetum coccineum]
MTRDLYHSGPGSSTIILSLEAPLISYQLMIKSESRYLVLCLNESNSVTVAVSGVPEIVSCAYTMNHDGSEAPDESPGSILSNEPKPRGKHRPLPPPSIPSPGESSYPP